MDSFDYSWLALGLVLVLLVVWVVMRRARKRGPGGAKVRETQMVALVRRRRELHAQLLALAGDQGRQLLQAEARRLKGSPSDIAVLEAALARAERMSDRPELRPQAPTR
ncbi:hypothetical protein PGB34_11820 [Xenophilus arseniciresistens]|uniref:Uncharacterized protein n=1 Tax=Xenophilus arseniciresistens TaxID=1283306 RepID=A0AAE3SZZ8_9BURK|nr:hypothetical protein [Xenophilus arseniciresistens]MDA7417050.1 hypothetical protein [Xenophilus arseniciresistens]